jgi:8-oxo-dGTP pyrophosphatase MutT (NUDIX family)
VSFSEKTIVEYAAASTFLLIRIDMTASPNRDDLLARIRRYGSRFPERATVVERIAEFVLRDPRCAERENDVGHLTGSAWIVSKDRKRALLLHHRKLGRWIQLGGHADGEIDLLSVALKEAREESGLSQIRSVSHEIFDIDIHEIPEWKDVSRHLHFDVRFLFEADEGEKLVVNEESHGLAWVELGDLESYTQEESVLRMGRLTRALE